MHKKIRYGRILVDAEFADVVAAGRVNTRHSSWIRVLGSSMAVVIVTGCAPDLKRNDAGQGATAGNAGMSSSKPGTNIGGSKSSSSGGASARQDTSSAANQGGATGAVSSGESNTVASGGAVVGSDPIRTNGGVTSQGGATGGQTNETGATSAGSIGGNTGGVQTSGNGGSFGPTTASGGGTGGNSSSRVTSAAGGTPGTGGARPTGGAATGGTVATGGTKATGGTSASSTSECVAGSVQNCTLGNLRGRRGCSAQGTFETCMPLISLGNNHGCLVTSSGNVKCWGDNSDGQCGQDPATSASVQSPTKITTSASGLTADVISLSAGSGHTCAIVSIDASTSRTVCWGSNFVGELGSATPEQSATPLVVKNLTDAVSVHSGAEHNCVLTRSGQVKCWGRNNMGQMGNGTSSYASVTSPTMVPNQTGVLGVAVGGGTTCLINSSSRVLCWGDNLFGSVGDNGTAPGNNAASAEPCPMPCVTKPMQVVNLAADVIEVTGLSTFCALRTSGKVHCWGDAGAYRLRGRPPTSGIDAEFPTAVSGLDSAMHLALGEYQACAITRAGAAKCWGSNQYGGLGSGDPVSSDTVSDLPVQVSGLESGILRIVSGNAFVCAVNSSGLVSCWGRNPVSQELSSIPLQLVFTP